MTGPLYARIIDQKNWIVLASDLDELRYPHGPVSNWSWPLNKSVEDLFVQS